METRTVALVALFVVLAMPLAVSAQETDPLAVVNAWHDALNAYDIDAALSHFADGAEVTFVPPLEGSGVYSGKEQIRALYEGFVAANFDCTLSDCRVDGDTVTCIDTYTDEDFQAMGVDFIEGEWVGIVRDGKIQSYTFSITPESLAKFPPPAQTLPETGGRAPAAYTATLLMALGGLALLGGLGLWRLSSRQRR
jgi:hypothetical protein